jgi:23S rRNA (cytidine1920-2'-O)/16S rRNA (cytidine1409-2'-O)-methyltransferase
MNPKAPRARLDILLVERGFAASQQEAQAMILAGEVQMNGNRADKAGVRVAADARIEVTSRKLKYASRGGLKLEGALQDFVLSPFRHVCLDVGSSTGGFTDCLLQRDAAKVYAVDVNTSQLAWKLQQDPRVIQIRRNARAFKSDDLPEQVDLVLVDVSFISIGKIIVPVSACARPGADFLLLVKPQFELGRKEVGPGGIVKDAQLHEKAIATVKKAAEAAGLICLEVHPSRLPGAEGNQEFFMHARKSPMK